MKKIFLILIVFVLFSFLKPSQAFASNSFVTVVNPVRGKDFWQIKESPSDGVNGEIEVLKKFNVPATWLLRVDALEDANLVSSFKSIDSSNELGLFLEVTPSWTNMAGVKYQKSEAWQFAGSVFLTGYNTSDREKLIDAAFDNFKSIFGYYPKSVGAWWIDSNSLSYMKNKYQVNDALIVSDQYTTDNYQIWGQYWSTPYYPSQKDLLLPAQSKNDKLGVVVMQWAARDPVNGYGKGVEESTYSVQANDYVDYHDLKTDYFSKLVDIYTNQSLNNFNQLTVGLENSYSWSKYKDEYYRQIQTLENKQKSGQFQFSTMSNFASWYQNQFPEISPAHIIVASDPLGSFKKAVWFMDPYYRSGWFYNEEGSVFRDIRQYVNGSIEPCFDAPCKTINFATFSARVLDEITYQQNWLLDNGEISNFSVKKNGENYQIDYTNDAGNNRVISLMPRDISFDGKIKSIDSLILDVIQNQKQKTTNLSLSVKNFTFDEKTILSLIISGLEFLVFIFICLLVPGFVIINKVKPGMNLQNIFLSVILGSANLTLVSFVAGYFNLNQLVFVYVAVVFFISLLQIRQIYYQVKLSNLNLVKNSPIIFLILIGIIFQVVPVFKSGLDYHGGVGFWGPNSHDGVWHLALINQLISKVPPLNPIFSGDLLSNYHYFYDLLIAQTYILTHIKTTDLVFRFYPILFSLLLGVGTWTLSEKIFKNKISVVVSLYFVYFAGSFGWIVDYIKNKQILAGESDFWANQSISFNLNPPFAISLLFVMAIILLLVEYLHLRKKLLFIPLILISGTLIEFKVYAGVIILLGLGVITLYEILFKKNFSLIIMFVLSTLLSALVFLPQNSQANDLLVISPFWFIHSMIDFPDRVGWEKLSAARLAYFERGQWSKWLLAELLGLMIFILGNLGTRFIFFISAPQMVKRKIIKNEKLLFITILMFASLLIPIIFIQKGNPWNTIQFIYYFIYIAALLCGGVVIFLRNKILKALFIIILIITPISSLSTFIGYLYPIPHAYIPQEEVHALEFLKNQPNGIVLTYPYDKNLKQRYGSPLPLLSYDTTAYVSAFSNKQTYMEDEIQQEIFQTDYKKRLVSENDFFNGRDPNWSRDFLRKNNITYIYLPKVYNASLSNQLGLKKIFENSSVNIYRLE